MSNPKKLILLLLIGRCVYNILLHSGNGDYYQFNLDNLWDGYLFMLFAWVISFTNKNGFVKLFGVTYCVLIAIFETYGFFDAKSYAHIIIKEALRYLLLFSGFLAGIAFVVFTISPRIFKKIA